MKNITFKFKDKTIDLSSKGEVLGNDVSVEAVLKMAKTVSVNIMKNKNRPQRNLRTF